MGLLLIRRCNESKGDKYVQALQDSMLGTSVTPFGDCFASLPSEAGAVFLPINHLTNTTVIFSYKIYICSGPLRDSVRTGMDRSVARLSGPFQDYIYHI